MGSGGDTIFGGLVLGDDLRRRLRPGETLRSSFADASPWLLGLRRRRLSRSSSSRGEVTADILLSSYSTVTTLSGSWTSDVSDLRAGLCLGVETSSADSDPLGDVRARGRRRTLMISADSFRGFGDVASAASSSLLTSPALPEPLLLGRSFSELDGFEGLRCFAGGFFWPVLFPMYDTSAFTAGSSGCGCGDLGSGFSGDGGLMSSLLSCRSFFTILEGRTQALGMVLGGGRAVSFGGDCLLRQRESLTTRFLGAVATRTSSSSLFATGVFLGLVDRSGLTSADFLGVCAGFQLGLSSMGFTLGVIGFGESAEGVAGAVFGLSVADRPAFSAPPAASGSTSCCHRLILSLTLAGLLMPIAFAKSGPFMFVWPSWAPFFLPGVPFLFSGSVGSGETMRSRRHLGCSRRRRDRVVRFQLGCCCRQSSSGSRCLQSFTAGPPRSQRRRVPGVGIGDNGSGRMGVVSERVGKVKVSVWW